MAFARAYIKSTRLYYAFVTGIAGWVGVSSYHWLMPGHVNYTRSSIILAMLFLSWGINQIFNDYLGLPEDRINAPNRPMVTGELNAKWSLWLSSALLIGVLIVSFYLNPWSLIPVIAGVLLNILYEYAKAWSLIGNLIFGLSIAMCTAYGFLAAGPNPDPVFTSNRICAFVLVAILNGLMTYYTYFKDYEGDKSAGKRTFIVKHGLKVARQAGIVGAFLPTLGLSSLSIPGMDDPEEHTLQATVCVLCADDYLSPVVDGCAFLPKSGGRTNVLRLGYEYSSLCGRPDHPYCYLQRHSGALSVLRKLCLHRFPV
ncbi:MAG: UbiA family prenyltransferase [Armatimonadota bacterium]|nr:UbiA family prenyltransferase [bacterium]